MRSLRTKQIMLGMFNFGKDIVVVRVNFQLDRIRNHLGDGPLVDYLHCIDYGGKETLPTVGGAIS